ncbi:MAG TPA: hypothetical protein VK738_21065 [Terriglobales bacterium]|jgi:hypothetical protein|nr:hypothetical protein [Terriglobales bacterium]
MKKKLFKPEILLSHESGLRKMEAESTGQQYVSFKSLKEAQQDPQGIVILEGDEGGQIYVVCPVSIVRCSEESLQQLLQDLDALKWSDPSSAHLFYERLPLGSGVSGGMGGGLVQSSVWLRPRLVKLELLEKVKAVIEGRRPRLENVQ